MKKISNGIMELAESAVLALVAVMVLFSLFLRVYQVDGDSMLPTLKDQERMLVSQFLYQPKQGDIVCFVAENNDEKVLVKRIIATAGQTIDITEDRKVMIDGGLLDEPYLKEGVYTDAEGYPHFYNGLVTDEKSRITFPYTVAEGEVFCMGDNRFNSKDSRDLGAIETKYLLGRRLMSLKLGG